MKQLGHYETIAKMPKLDINCVLFLCEVSSENTGLILRSAGAFGARTVYWYNKDKNILNDKIKKLARGSKTHLIDVNNFEVLSSLQLDGFLLVAIEITDDSTPLRTFDLPPKVCFVIGNEQRGIPDEILKLVDKRCHIEMPNEDISSLNVSISASIALYELTTQRLETM